MADKAPTTPQDWLTMILLLAFVMAMTVFVLRGCYADGNEVTVNPASTREIEPRYNDPGPVK